MRRGFSAVCVLVSTAFVSIAAWHAAQQPSWNLDGIFYAVLMQRSAAPLADRHDAAYASTAALAPPEARAALESGSEYRRTLRSDLDAFAHQLPFYTNKPLYLWCGKLALACGAAEARAPYVVSALSFALIAAGVSVLAFRLGAPLWIAALSGLVMLFPRLRELASLATPDALATLWLVAGTCVSLRSASWAILPLMAASITRPDAAILALGILAAAWTREPTRPRALRIGAAAVLVATAAALVPVLTQSHGWQTLMHHTFVQRSVRPEHFQHTIGFGDYLDAVAKGLRGHDVSRVARFEPFLALSAISCIVYARGVRSERARAALHLVLAVWIATALRFLAFPAFGDRHFAPAFVISFACACALLARSRTPGLPLALCRATPANSADRTDADL